MADSQSAGGGSRHLDASGPREVVYCHQCHNEWYQDQSGLVCPRCESEVTEIVTPGSDPRPELDDEPRPPPGFMPGIHNHNPWAEADSDPDEADIEEHITHGPGGSVMFSRTIRTTNTHGFGNTRRRDNGPGADQDPDNVMRDFQNMIGSLMGPGFRPGQAGRSGPDTLFNQGPFGGGFRIGGNGPGQGPAVVGGRFTFTSGGNLRPRDANSPQQPGGPPVDDLATILGGLFRPMGPGVPGGPGDRDNPFAAHPGMPPGLQGLFAAMLNPAAARSGDAVYTQEALDQIISTLMEQHPTSNAPGPASPDAIAALPKKKVNEKQLGPEGKAECSVCMDDVHEGDEVVELPCTHWFHEACASAWLSEHNTCPICRKGIEGEATATPPSLSRRSSQSGHASRNEHRARRLSNSIRPRAGRDSPSNRNEARLDAIRSNARLSPTEEDRPSPIRWHTSGEPVVPTAHQDDYRSMPGSFSRRASDMSENQRDSRRGNTSGSDRSRNSHSSGNGGISTWFRDHFGSNRRNE